MISTDNFEGEMDEITGILKRDTFQVFFREFIPTDSNVLPGRFSWL